MKNIEGYAEPPFENLQVGRDQIVRFFDDHRNRLKQAVTNGEPFAELVAPTDAAFINLNSGMSSTVTSKTQLGSRTVSVDQLLLEFKEKALECEPYILTKFKKISAEYHEFFPNGRTEYSSANKGTIGPLFDQLILAFTNHKEVLGEELCNQFKILQARYTTARDVQQQQKENKGGALTSWDDYLSVMKDQVFHNILTIASHHRGHSERMRQYFDQSIITPHQHPSAIGDTGAYILIIPVTTTLAADILFTINDTLVVANTGDVPLFWFGAPAPDSSPPANAMLLPPGEEIEITAAMLGAPTNHYLLFSNKDENSAGEVEIIVC
jgi:hypothetical protein